MRISVVSLIPFALAVMVAVPFFMPATTPLSLTVTIEVSDEVQ